MAPLTSLHAAKHNSLFAQVLVLILAWSYMVSLHLGNDGLWFQGDAPRHAANGLFWRDFLARIPVNPFEFAVSYYLRYPVISPTAYPPGFYLLEAAAFSLFGISPFVGKAVVLIFTLVAGLYLTAWLRRWISEEAGWGGSLLVLQPGVISWSHVIMLNIPSMALSVAALYHARRWMEAPNSPHLYMAAFMTAFGILTYVHTGIVLLILFAWIVVERRWEILWTRRVLILGVLSALSLIFSVVVAIRWAPIHVSFIFPGIQNLLDASHWTYYLGHLPKLLGIPILVCIIVSMVGSVRYQDGNREFILALIWFIVGWLTLSFIRAQELRYALLFTPPAVLLGVIGLSLARWVPARIGWTPWLLKIGIPFLLAIHILAASSISVPVVSGFQPVVTFLEKEASNEMIFYDGGYNGVFSFYLRAGDPEFKRGVVRGNKLLYPSAIDPEWHLTERASSRADVVELLRKECGCRWLVIERPVGVGFARINAVRYLREALNGTEFQFVRSFHIHIAMGANASHHDDDMFVDVYRFLPAINIPTEREFRMPILGEGTVIRGKPLQ